MDAKRLAEALKSLDNQNFGPNDSTILSTINHPVNAGGKFLDWLKSQVNTAAGIPDQYDNPYPLLAPSPEAQSQAAFDLAGMAQVGSMPFAPKSSGGTLGTFIGPKAATWDPDKAEAAAKLLDDGVDPAQVWQQHMIGRMPDGKLFSEIDDSKSVTQGLGILARSVDKQAIEQGAPKGFPNWVWMNHDDLYKNYPELKDIYINPTSSIDSAGSFDPSTNMMNLSALGKDTHSTTLHELQHAIQQREGWARGGSPEQFSNGRVKDVLKESLSAIEKEQAVLRSLYSTADDATKQQIINKNKELNARKTDLQRMDEGRLMVDSYRRLTGEAQARATQDRLNMNMDERRANYPLAGGKLSDIPLEQLIYRYGDKAARLLPATMLGYGMANQKPDNQSIAEALRDQ